MPPSAGPRPVDNPGARVDEQRIDQWSDHPGSADAPPVDHNGAVRIATVTGLPLDSSTENRTCRLRIAAST